jgi:inosine-uridine nucleoside N-ribohydrolase
LCGIIPKVKEKIARFYVMGGAVLVDGNVAPDNHAEWNFYIDPVADNILLRAGIPITLGSLDYTENVPLTKSFVSQMKPGRQPLQPNFYTVTKRPIPGESVRATTCGINPRQS